MDIITDGRFELKIYRAVKEEDGYIFNIEIYDKINEIHTYLDVINGVHLDIRWKFFYNIKYINQIIAFLISYEEKIKDALDQKIKSDKKRIE